MKGGRRKGPGQQWSWQMNNANNGKLLHAVWEDFALGIYK